MIPFYDGEAKPDLGCVQYSFLHDEFFHFGSYLTESQCVSTEDSQGNRLIRTWCPLRGCTDPAVCNYNPDAVNSGTCTYPVGILDCDGKYDDAHIDSLSNDQKKEYFRGAAVGKLAVRKTIRDYLKSKASGGTKAEKRQAMIQNRFEVDESDLRQYSYQLYGKKPFLLVAPETGDSTDTSDCHLDLSEEPDNERHIIYPSGVGNYAYLCNNGQFIARQGEQQAGNRVIMYTQCWDGDAWSDTTAGSQSTEEGGVDNIVCNGFPIGIGSMSSKCETSEPCLGCDGIIDSGKVVDECGVCGGDNSTCTDCAGIVNEVVDALCGGDDSSCAGCDGVANSGLVVDECGVCGGDDSSCAGCDGVANSGLVEDACGVCGGDDSSCAGCDGVAMSRTPAVYAAVMILRALDVMESQIWVGRGRRCLWRR